MAKRRRISSRSLRFYEYISIKFKLISFVHRPKNQFETHKYNEFKLEIVNAKFIYT